MSNEKIKVLFLDVDGVLNSNNNLFFDRVIEDDKLQILKSIVEQTNAKLVLSSNWRCDARSLSRLWTALENAGLTLYSMTPFGVKIDDMQKTPWKDVQRYDEFIFEDEINNDRGAEIAWWIWCRREKIDKFAIVDDEDVDIRKYFPNNIVKTGFSTGLTLKDAAKIVKMLEDQ